MNFSQDSFFSQERNSGGPPVSLKPKGKGIIALLLAVLIVLSAMTIGGAWFLYRMYQTLPTLDQLENIEPPLSSKVMGKDGTLVYEFSIEKRSWVPLRKIPENLINAVLSIEDRKFYDHWGVDIKRILGAMIVNLLRGHYAQGGSTITQQLARNVYLSSQTSMIRKIREAMTAVQIESYYTKREILELYLNQVYFGAGVYGVEAASRCYFNKPVSRLDLNECAVLAGIIQLPERYRPDKKKNQKRIAARRSAVLHAMLKMHFIDERTIESVSQYPVPCNPQKDISQHAPYFVELVRQYAEQKYGDDLLYNGGLTIYTTLDPIAQDSTEKAAAGHLKELQKKMNSAFLWKTGIYQRHHIPRDTFLVHFDSLYNVYKKECDALPDSLHLRVLQTAVVALDVKTGGVLALIGGRDFIESKFNRAIQAVRQPGSSFKPFLYTAAMEHGFAPSSLVMDQPITLQTPQGEWRPENYEGTFEGPVTIRHAIEHSLNLAAIQTIIQVGPDTVINYARRMGLKQRLEAVPSLAIGSCEVIPMEMATAYSIFPNKGVKVAPFFVKRIVDRNGKILEEHEHNEVQVLSSATAYIMCDLLTGVVRRGTAAAIPGLGFTRPSAGKTGTSNDYADAWYIGFTPQIICCVWVGVDERRSMGTGMTGAQAAVPIFARAMISLHKKLPIEYFTKPDSIVNEKVCLTSHKPALASCPQTYDDCFILGRLPDRCDMHGPGKMKKSNMMKLFGPQEKHETRMPAKKRLTF
jgi:penicillin-binding protein, 1A family